ncbi:MAG TPA: helix-turn-helix domain-containing protein [Lentimicrobium sp.]|jgi:AcrR family transcriptional regulator|nr:helix-turn-helix domain-containing protein [Lentimicrobium sp.]
MDEKLISILEGAIKLFKQYGLRSISMDEIARSLSMSKKTLYQYVDNKDDLIIKALDYIIAKTKVEEIEKDENLNAIDVLLEISRIVRTEVVEMNPVVKFDLFKFYPSIYHKAVMKKKEMIFNDIIINFNRGIEQGLYRKDVDIELTAKLYIQNLLEIHDPEFMNAPLSKVFVVMFDTLIRSIVNEEGLKYYEQKIKPQAI